MSALAAVLELEPEVDWDAHGRADVNEVLDELLTRASTAPPVNGN